MSQFTNMNESYRSTYRSLIKEAIWKLDHQRFLIANFKLRQLAKIVWIQSLCYSAAESSGHLFLECPFACQLWHWLSSAVNEQIDTTNVHSVLSICKKHQSSQLSDTISVTIINTIWIIWNARNKMKFEGMKISVRAAINQIKASVSLSGNMSKNSMYNSIDEFKILKWFGVAGHPRKAPKIIQVDWLPPMCGQIKVNTDGATKGSLGRAGEDAIFRDRSGAVLGCFANYFGITDSFTAELYAAIAAINVAIEKGWSKIWMECDSSLVVQAYSNPDIFPLKIRTKWKNCIQLSSSFDFRISHVFREGNHCPDKLASFGVIMVEFDPWIQQARLFL